MTTNFALQTRTVTSADEWRAILEQLPSPHPLQSWAWGELKSRWGWTMQPLVWEADGVPQAAAMLLRKQFPRTPFCMFYAPKGPILDYTNHWLRRLILKKLVEFAAAERAIFVKIDPDVMQATGVEPEPFPTGTALVADFEGQGWRYSAEQIQFRNSVTLDLEREEAAILKAMKQKTRYNIRLATRREVTVRVGTPDDFPMIAEMYATTSQRNDFMIRPSDYYLDAWQTFHDAGMLRLLIAEYEGRPIAAVHIVHNHDIALYMYGASDNSERNRMPTYLLQWEAIRWAREHGCTLYDFWGAPDDFVEDDRMWGVWKFKRGFNGTVAHHVGAWDYPVWPRLYGIFTDLLPRYRDLLRRIRS